MQVMMKNGKENEMGKKKRKRIKREERAGVILQWIEYWPCTWLPWFNPHHPLCPEPSHVGPN